MLPFAALRRWSRAKNILVNKIQVQILRLYWRAEKCAEENKFCREQSRRLPHFWVQFPPDLRSCAYKLPPHQKFHHSGREDAVARREVSWVLEIFFVILWETEWFDGHIYWWDLMEILLSQYYIPGIKSCVSAFSKAWGLISCCSKPQSCPHCIKHIFPNHHQWKRGESQGDAWEGSWKANHGNGNRKKNQ